MRSSKFLNIINWKLTSHIFGRFIKIVKEPGNTFQSLKQASRPDRNTCHKLYYYYTTLHKKWTFPLRISSVDLVRFSEEILTGTLMQISEFANIFVFTWKYDVENFTLKHLLCFEICAREILKSLFTNIQKQWNKIKISLLFKKFSNFTGK